MYITAIADPRAAPNTLHAVVNVKAACGVTPSQVAERLSDLPEVVYVFWVTDFYDLLVELVCDTSEDLTEFFASHFHTTEDVAEAELMLGLKNFKNQFLLKKVPETPL